jgi:hypothetical protein
LPWMSEITAIFIGAGLSWKFGLEARGGDKSIFLLGRSQTTEVIFGRDVLNQLIVTLNGLAFITEISD